MIYDLQKASLMKRFSAFLLDFILFVILFTGSMLIFHQVTGYNDFADSLTDRKTEIEAKYDIPEIEEKYKVNPASFQLMAEEERSKLPSDVLDKLIKCTNELNNDEEYLKLLLIMVNLILVIVSLSLLLPHLVLEFIVPLIFKNGQTLGKKVFGIAVMKTDAVKINTLTLFIRTVLGKYTIGTMVPLLMVFMLLFGTGVIIPIAVILLVLVLQVVMLVTTKTNSLLHDVLSSTVVVDFQSQMIFDSVEAKKEYQLRIHNEEADKANN